MNTYKIIKHTIDSSGNETTVYRYPIMAGMQFTYSGTKNNKIKKVGYYDFELITNSIGETISEKKINIKMY